MQSRRVSVVDGIGRRVEVPVRLEDAASQRVLLREPAHPRVVVPGPHLVVAQHVVVVCASVHVRVVRAARDAVVAAPRIVAVRVAQVPARVRRCGNIAR